MSSTVNLEALNEAQLRFVTRLSNTTLESLLAELPEDQQLELEDRSQVVEVIHQGKRYVLAGGDRRRQHDEERRNVRRTQARLALEQMARVKRKRVDPKKLASQAGRMLERLKAHKYFIYRVNPQGVLEWEEKQATLRKETQRDGWYLLHTNCPVETCAKGQVLGHYKNLLDVAVAFCQLQSYLEVRPIYHWRPDRVRNHARLCFVGYWLSAGLGKEWRACGKKGEVPRILRRLQSIRLGQLQVGGKPARSLMTEVPKELNEILEKLGLIKLFTTMPDWAL